MMWDVILCLKHKDRGPKLDRLASGSVIITFASSKLTSKFLGQVPHIKGTILENLASNTFSKKTF